MTETQASPLQGKGSPTRSDSLDADRVSLRELRKGIDALQALVQQQVLDLEKAVAADILGRLPPIQGVEIETAGLQTLQVGDTYMDTHATSLVSPVAARC